MDCKSLMRIVYSVLKRQEENKEKVIFSEPGEKDVMVNGVKCISELLESVNRVNECRI